MKDADATGFLSHFHKEERPWGGFEEFTLNEPTTVKILSIKPNESLSLQTHEHRDEFWRIVQGSGTVTLDDTVHEATVGDYFLSKRGTKHRVAGGPDGVVFLEIAFGEFNESDITRFEDKYGRT